MTPRALSAVVLLSLIALPVFAQQSWPPPDPEQVEHARALLREVPLIDGHNDLATSLLEVFDGDLSRGDIARRQPQLSADLPRLREGMIGAQFWPAFAPSETMYDDTELAVSLRSIDMVHQFVERYDELEFASTADDIEHLFQQGKIGSMIGIEGGHMIDNSLPVLRMFYDLGARYMTLTHFRTTDWADASNDVPRHGGLTEFGESVVREMNRLGMFVDLSHVSAEAMLDALRVSQAPVIFSHSSARGVNPHPRNVPDHILRRVTDNGGVVMVNFIGGYIAPTADEWKRRLIGDDVTKMILTTLKSGNEPLWALRHDTFLEELHAELDDAAEIRRQLQQWIDDNPAPRGHLGDVADHIDHIREVAGIDNIGIGSDFFDDGQTSMAVGLEDPSRYPMLFAELLQRGYSDDDIKRIAGLNLLRAMRQMERVAERLRRQQTPGLARVSIPR